jgi:ribonuclease R
MGALAVHCSQRERRAEEAERDVDERFKCAWMSKHVGSEFDGVVTGVTSFGLFVELDESKVSGLVHISQLANDYYHFDPLRKLLKGEKSGEQFRLGDHVRVQVLRASLEDRKIDFRLVPAKKKGVSPPRTAKAYDYSASGERYSLPKTAAAPAAAPEKAGGMFGRAARAVGRAFGRRDAEVPVAAPVSDNPPPRAYAKGGRALPALPEVPASPGRSKAKPASRAPAKPADKPAKPPKGRGQARKGRSSPSKGK